MHVDLAQCVALDKRGYEPIGRTEEQPRPETGLAGELIARAAQWRLEP